MTSSPRPLMRKHQHQLNDPNESGRREQKIISTLQEPIYFGAVANDLKSLLCADRLISEL